MISSQSPPIKKSAISLPDILLITLFAEEMKFALTATLAGLVVSTACCRPTDKEKDADKIMNKDAPGFTADWKKDGDMPPVDETKADQYVGKVVLIGVTYENAKGEISGRQQWAGIIKTYSNKEGIQVDLFDSEEFCALPPWPDAISPAKPGVYRLKSTGREIEDPDYLATWICTAPDPHEEPNSEQDASPNP
jgi:hypothetical protein